MKKETVVKLTSWLVNFMYYGGMVVTLSLPYTVKKLGEYLEQFQEHYAETVMIYFILGILAILIIGELRKMFRTVRADDCFVYDNVVSLQRMGTYSFMIAVMSLVRTILYPTVAMLVVILVFVIAGCFSKVLSFVFDKAVQYKNENDLTI